MPGFNPNEARDAVGRWAHGAVSKAISKGKDTVKRITPALKQHSESKRAAAKTIHSAVVLTGGVLAGASLAGGLHRKVKEMAGNGSSHKNVMSTNYSHPKSPNTSAAAFHANRLDTYDRMAEGEYGKHIQKAIKYGHEIDKRRKKR